jgi:hypothetical protein
MNFYEHMRPYVHTRMNNPPVTDRQFDLFVPFIADLPLRDQRETMERPFFSLSKNKRLKPIEYTSPDRQIYVHVFPNQEFGMATIWDADILIWAASTLCELKKKRANDIPIGSRIAYSRAQQTGQAAQEIEPDGKAAQEIKELYAYVCMNLNAYEGRGENHDDQRAASGA